MKRVKRETTFIIQRSWREQESVDVFSGIKIPEAWDSSYSLLQTEVSIHAQAVQAANFTPDFSAMSPWGDLDIENVYMQIAIPPAAKTKL